MKLNFVRSTAAIFFFSALTLVSCERDEDVRPGTETEEEQTLENSSTGEDASDDVLEMSYRGEYELASSGGRVSSDLCATVTHDKVNKKVTIDFGTGCTGPYGRVRKGKIIITYSNTLGDSLANRIITFENYFVNDKGITGTIELRDAKINASGNLQVTKTLKNLKVTFADGTSITYNGSRTREWLAGAGDNDPSNNKFRITGQVSGVSSTGRTFTHIIVEPIISDWSCAAAGKFARVKGTVELTRLDGYTTRKRTVDYGDGTCDNTITIITFRRTYTVTVN